MVSGGMDLQLIPLSLISLAEISFFDPLTETYSSSFDPIDGGPPVTPALATARSSHTQTTLLDGRVLMTGGHAGAEGTDVGTPVASVEIFDPATGDLTAGPDMSASRAGHSATTLPDGRVVVAGGSTWEIFLPDPRGSDSWSAPFALERSRTDHAAVALADHAGPGQHRVLLIAGSGSGPTTLEMLDPDAGMSTLMTSALSVGVDDLAAARLDDGRVLIVGGQNLAGGDTVGQSYLFDPIDTIVAAPSPPGFPSGLADHQLVGLGRFAIVLGGEQQVAGVDTELDHSAIYDRAAGDWIFDSAMNFAHDDFAAVRLADGRILVVDGGVPFAGQELPSANTELFTADSGNPADVDCDGDVDINDFLALIAAWGPCPEPCPPRCPADIDADCDVDINDFLLLIANWTM